MLSAPQNTVTMSSHEEDDQDLDREEIHVDVESMDSKASCGGGGSDSEIDMDDTGSCYDDTDIAIRFVERNIHGYFKNCSTKSSNSLLHSKI